MNLKVVSTQLEALLPTGPDLLGTVNANIVANFRQDRGSTIRLPSLWRLAKHVTSDRPPLVVFNIDGTPP